jgi:3-oxoacyl-[acyl-carrier protein] reductase
MARNSEEKLLNKKIAVVTGGTRGIGHAITKRLLAEGASVAFCGVTQSTVDRAVTEFTPFGPVFGAVCDVSRRDQVATFFADLINRFGTIDILINNAGAGTFRATADLSPDEWDRMISLNLSGVFYCCREVLPILRNKGAGDIVNISSLAAKNPFAGGAGYNASKFGLNGFSEAMMLDHRADGVRVCSIMPGSVATGFGGGAPDPEDVAEAVVSVLRMPARTTISRVEIRPSKPPSK